MASTYTKNRRTADGKVTVVMANTKKSKHRADMKELLRTCASCGKTFKVKVRNNGRIVTANGYPMFFGRISLPVPGTGRYRKTGKVLKLGSVTMSEVVWTGKYKRPEYWECGCEEKHG